MMPAILWKEYREHRMVWAALAFLGAITVLGLSYMMGVGWLGRPSDARITLCAFAVMVVGAYALICGAMMLAGERENGTMPYLDALPGFRRLVWQGKFLAGVLLVLAQIVLLMSLSAGVSLFENWQEAAFTLAAMFVTGLYGFSWGMLFSSFGRSVMNMLLISLAALAALVIGTGYLAQLFAAETPNVHSNPEINAFRASLPTPEPDESGPLFHTACLRFDDVRRALDSQQMPPQPLVQNERRKQRDADVLEHGWPAKDRELVVWSDQLYAGEWPTLLKQAADLPTSPFDDVRNWTILEPVPATVNSSDVAVALALRGLQRQAAGDDEAYVENLRIGLALSRSLRDRAPAIDLIFGRTVEGTLLKGLDRWLEKLHGKPDLIRQALALLSRHLDETADDGKDVEAIEALIGQNSLDIPLSLDQYLSFYGGSTSQDGISGRVRFVTASLVPWEKARLVRIFRLMDFGDRQQQSWFIGRENEVGALVQFGPNGSLINRDRLMNLAKQPGGLCVARAMQLKLALRWYQADHGKPAETLDELVPKYLPSLPLNPFDDKPFRYQLSRGEEIVLPPGANTIGAGGAAPTEKVPAGQGVLWSEGKDRVFLVPLPSKAK